MVSTSKWNPTKQFNSQFKYNTNHRFEEARRSAISAHLAWFACNIWASSKHTRHHLIHCSGEGLFKKRLGRRNRPMTSNESAHSSSAASTSYVVRQMLSLASSNGLNPLARKPSYVCMRVCNVLVCFSISSRHWAQIDAGVTIRVQPDSSGSLTQHCKHLNSFSSPS